MASDRAAFTGYLLGSIRRLAAAGVDFIAITANTPHLVFDDLTAGSSVPLISIVEVCARAASQSALGRTLLGTRFTMEATFYPEVCARFGVAVIVPDAEDRTWIHDCYVNELLKGQFRGEASARFAALVQRLRGEQGIDGVILGGTELPLLLTGTSIGRCAAARHDGPACRRDCRTVAGGCLGERKCGSVVSAES